MNAKAQRTDGFTDEEIWRMELQSYTSAAIILRKAELIAEAATYLLPCVHRVLRRIDRTQKRIEAYLELAQENPTLKRLDTAAKIGYDVSNN